MQNSQVELIESFLLERQSNIPKIEKIKSTFKGVEESYQKYLQNYPMLHKIFFSLQNFEYFFKLNISLAFVQEYFSAEEIKTFIFNYFKYSYEEQLFRNIAKEFIRAQNIEEQYLPQFILKCLLFISNHENEEDYFIEEASMSDKENTVAEVANEQEAEPYCEQKELKDMQELREEKELLMGEIEKLEEEMLEEDHQLKEEIEEKVYALSIEIRDLESENQNLLEKMHNNERNYEELSNEQCCTLNSLSEKIEELEIEKQQQEILVDLYKNEKLKLQDQIGSLTQELSKEKEFTEQLISKQEETVGSLKEELLKEHNNYCLAMQIIKQENSDMKQLGDTNLKISNDYKKLESSMQETLEKSESAQKELKSLNNSNVDYQEEKEIVINRLREEIIELEKELADNSNALSCQAQESKKLETEYEDFRNEVNSIVNGKVSMPEELVELTDRLSNAADEIQRLQAEKQAMQDEIEQIFVQKLKE